MNGWIAVKHQKPISGDTILVYYKIAIQLCGKIEYISRIGIAQYIIDNYDEEKWLIDGEKIQPVYWLPIPEIPKG